MDIIKYYLLTNFTTFKLYNQNFGYKNKHVSIYIYSLILINLPK